MRLTYSANCNFILSLSFVVKILFIHVNITYNKYRSNISSFTRIWVNSQVFSWDFSSTYTYTYKFSKISSIFTSVRCININTRQYKSSFLLMEIIELRYLIFKYTPSICHCQCTIYFHNLSITSFLLNIQYIFKISGR